MSLRFNPLFKLPRTLMMRFFAACYPFVTKIWPLPKVLSIEETIRILVDQRMSIARFGDGEFLYVIDKLSLPFQRYEEGLAEVLKDILKNDVRGLLVGMPSGYHGMTNLKQSSQTFWKSQISWIYPRLRKYLLQNRTYANASITRLYHEVEDKSVSEKHFSMIRELWRGRSILLVEGAKSRLGVGNDLFANAIQIERILAPPVNAYDKFGEIIQAVKTHATTDRLILVALGPTAKAVVYMLHRSGYQAVDIGNLDIEYEWFLKGTAEKERIPGKYTSEAKGGRVVEDILDEQYFKQTLLNLEGDGNNE